MHFKYNLNKIKYKILYNYIDIYKHYYINIQHLLQVHSYNCPLHYYIFFNLSNPIHLVSY